jgi:uncharacterized membrane protein YfcA
MELLTVLLLLGVLGGFASGLLGIGGGIIMVPLLLYVPPLLGTGTLDMKTVAGITALQSFVGAVSGAIGHQRYKRISRSLVLHVGGSMAAASLIGSVASKYVESGTILMVFAGMALAAALMMFVPRPDEEGDAVGEDLRFNRTLAIAIGLVVGSLGGLIGQGGAFLFIPAMLYLLRVPTRVAIGSALAIGILASIAVLIGRIGTNQIPYMMATVLVVGVLIGAQVGSVFSQRTPRAALRRVLAVLITATAAKIWYELLVVGSA